VRELISEGFRTVPEDELPHRNAGLDAVPDIDHRRREDHSEFYYVERIGSDERGFDREDRPRIHVRNPP
jgi:hypothetical protein